jgi:signal transduction histidine kinase/ligand-binding sensor domain-containing protein
VRVTGRSVHAVCYIRLGARYALLGALLFVSQLSALNPRLSITQYAHSAWTRQGSRLPGSVLTLAQTPDGKLWIGTEFGLLEFDGIRFQPRLSQQLAGDYINTLGTAPDGSLWIGTLAGLSHWTGNRVQNYRTGKNSAGQAVRTIVVDRGGTVWAGTAGYRSGGLCRVEGDLLRCYDAADGLPGAAVLSTLEDHSGNLWVGGVGFRRWKAGAGGIEPLYEPGNMVYSMVEDQRGEIWASTETAGAIKHLTHGKLVSCRIPAADSKIQPGALLSDRDGGLWIATRGQGLFHLHDGRVDRFTHSDGLSDDFIRCLFEDREGNVWVATDGGLDRFRDLPIARITRREGLSANSVGSVFPSKDGGVWIGTEGGLNHLEKGKIDTYYRRDGLPSDSTIGLFEEKEGRVWVASTNGLTYFEQGRFHLPEHPLARQIQQITGAAEDNSGCLWFSDPELGMIRVRNTHIVEVVPWSRFGDHRASALEFALDSGGLWLGFVKGGVAYYKPGFPIQWYTSADGLGRGGVMDLHLARDGALWVATEGGLSQLHNGRVTTLTTAKGLPCNRIHAMVEDDRGALWLNTACGLVRISGSDLSRWSANPESKIAVTLYDADDGMRVRPTAAGYFRRAAKSTDGRLWFAVFDGVAVVDPAHLAENRLSPPVAIRQITAGHTDYPIQARLQLPPHTRELQIDYAAMSFAVPEKVRFRYRLEGFDRDWVDAGARRQAVYTNLPPDHYRFRVIACNNDGVWNEAGAVWEFSIKPAYYQTNWFRWLCAVACALFLWSLHVLRLRRMAAQMNVRFTERLAERTRIAGDMHDTLLQNIAGFALQLDGLSKTVSSPAKERIRDIRRQAEQCMREAREFVWDLRAPTLEEKDLLSALREAGEEILIGKPVQFHVTVSGNRRPASVKLQQQLFRIVQEATRNAVRHGEATEIVMQIDYLDADVLRVHMRDDGRGFDLEEALRKLGHWGLTTMQERARQLGGELKISSAPGHGTQIDILVPINSSVD